MRLSAAIVVIVVLLATPLALLARGIRHPRRSEQRQAKQRETLEAPTEVHGVPVPATSRDAGLALSFTMNTRILAGAVRLAFAETW